MKSKLSLIIPYIHDHGAIGIIAYAIHRVDRLSRRRLFRQRYTIKRIHGHPMILDLHDEGICRQLLQSRTREKDALYMLRNTLQEGMTVLDIGANIGYYVLLELNLIGRSGFVYAVEPVQSNIDLLRRNLQLNNVEDLVGVHEVGISNRTDLQRIYLSENYCSLHTFYPMDDRPEDDISPGTDASSIEVSTTTISEFVRGKRKIDFIRMDIEGHEVEAFQGMKTALDTTDFRPLIMFEAHSFKYIEPLHSMRSALNLLYEYGYLVHLLSSKNHHRSSDEFRRRGYKPVKTIWTDGDQRGIYVDVQREYATDLICETEFVRTVLLAPIEKIHNSRIGNASG